MGVTYKLTDDVVAFILDQKQKANNLSCRELVDLVEQQFGRVVSKSSVHEVLKEANITSQRGRKAKFQIPDNKKAEMIANLPPTLGVLVPALPAEELVKEESLPLMPSVTPEDEIVTEEQEAPLTLMPDPVALPMENSGIPTSAEEKLEPAALAPLEEKEETLSFNELLLRATFHDLFPNPWSTIKNTDDLKNMDKDALEKEAVYRLQMMVCFKIELHDGSIIFMDARNHHIKTSACKPMRLAPVESAIMRMADTLINNIKPLIIRNIDGEFFDAAAYDFFKAMNNDPEKHITRIVLQSSDDDLTEFAPIVRIKRNFIVKVSKDNKDIQPVIQKPWPALQIVSTYMQNAPIRFFANTIHLGSSYLRAITLLSDNQEVTGVLLTNMDPKMSDAAVVSVYMQTYMEESLPYEDVTSPGAEDLLTAHAMRLFGAEALSMAAQAGICPIKNTYNASINLITVSIPDSYRNNAVLNQACIALNNLDIIDSDGRKIWARLG